ncbi:MAG: excinuclease ABC subunit UvrA, partial [Verrucomicrobiales bacterium]
DPHTDEEIQPDSPESAAAWAVDALFGKQVLITFPVPIPADTKSAELFPFLSQQGFLRIVLDGKVLRTDEPPQSEIAKLKSHIDVVQDRLPLTPANRLRLLEALESAFHLGKGRASLTEPSSFNVGSSTFDVQRSFSNTWHNPATGFTLRAPVPSLFSFNNPLGACPKCRGFGRVIGLDLDKAVPDPGLSIRKGAIKPFQGERGDECQKDLLRHCRERDIDITCPWEDLDEEVREWIYYGDRKNKEGTGGSPGDMEDLEELWRDGKWYGVKGFFDWLETKSYKMHVRVFLSRYRSYTACPDCRGKRLQPEALCFKVSGKTLPDLWALPVSDLQLWFSNLQSTISNPQSPDPSLQLILTEITTRLRYLDEVGLGYLTLDRQTRTLSGGEIERVNLTTCLGASLTGTLFVLDEPTVGLHPRDIHRLVGIMHGLRDKGNTLVVVEHEEAVMRAADHLIDLGPGAGQHGGEIVYQGPIEVPSSKRQVPKKKSSKTSTVDVGRSMLDVPASGTLPWLSGARSIAIPKIRRKPGKANLEIRGASRHNLRKLNVTVPLGLFCCLTGVSGSGKSTFVHDVLYLNLARKFGKVIDGDAARVSELLGTSYLGGVELVDQSPIARTPRSTPAVFLGAFDPIRQLFANTRDAKARDLNTGFFSFNSGDGRCDRCAGAGFEKVEMQFLSDLYVTCPDCNGRRFKSSTLDIHYLGKSIADILELTVDEAIAFYASDGIPSQFQKRHSQIVTLLSPLAEVGLGYLKLGQPLNTLSGGESQRIKLCQLLAETDAQSPNAKGKLLILDEPTTGLHFTDIERLLGVFQSLVDSGHSLLVIEHNLDVMKCADWILDLGPEAGAKGGQLVGEGPPEHIITLGTETAIHLHGV